jgi:hypothetical protein
MKSETRNAKQEIINLFDTRLCTTMLTRSKYVFHGEATINLITTIISDRYFQFDTMDAITTSMDDIEVIPTRTAGCRSAEAVHVEVSNQARTNSEYSNK